MVPISRNDLGNTNATGNILLKYDGFYEHILHFIGKIANFSDESKYRYPTEVAVFTKHFFERRQKEKDA